jgi:uncharacterized membrane protein HdeD (DUF308 family)
MSMNKPDIEQIQRAVVTSLHKHWVLFLVEGIILIILGLAAVIISPIATLAVEILYGWLFLISGIVGLITTFRTRSYRSRPSRPMSLFIAILSPGCLPRRSSRCEDRGDFHFGQTDALFASRHSAAEA